jgi:hypothetical protein
MDGVGLPLGAKTLLFQHVAVQFIAEDQVVLTHGQGVQGTAVGRLSPWSITILAPLATLILMMTGDRPFSARPREDTMSTGIMERGRIADAAGWTPTLT